MTTRGWHTIMALLALLSAGPATAAGRGPNLEAMQKRYDQFAAAGNYAAALVEAQKLEAAIKSLSGTADNNFGTALTMEAEANWHLGRYREAESIYTQALPIKEQALGASHPSVARMLGNLGLIYLDEARYRDAEGVFRRSLAVFEHAPGEEADVAHTLDNLANAFEAQGRYPEAEDLFKRSVPIKERLYGTSHSSVADTLHNLSRVYVSQGRYQDAEGLLKRALSIRNRTPGGNGPQLAITLESLGLVYDAEGRYGEAEGLLKQALGTKEQVLGPNHPEVAATLSNLAMAYGHEDRQDEAEGLLKRALAIDEKTKGAKHPDVASDLANLGIGYTSQGRYGEARLAQSLPSLLDTADELKTVAAALGAPVADIHLDRDATETRVKRTPLENYRVVYFATHGLVAGDVKGLGEPSLALTLPIQPSELDDGLLTASEVAQLKLDADWVVLSACNTAACDKSGAEALSGLARAFF